LRLPQAQDQEKSLQLKNEGWGTPGRAIFSGPRGKSLSVRADRNSRREKVRRGKERRKGLA
jgi:hypothetical protein